ncbi:MAG: serine/threonine protein kinase [Oscillatoria sp. SIO1A7]|nr:serine/threonine protein kinase [Oscillatoria sp. SIO1A7]
MAGKKFPNWFKWLAFAKAPPEQEGKLDRAASFLESVESKSAKGHPPERLNSSQSSGQSSASGFNCSAPSVRSQDALANTLASKFANTLPLEKHGYKAIEELGHNYAGGRSTYLAVNTKNRQPAVIKQFQFAKPGADWSAYKAHDREIKVLRGLSHPGIPRYIDSFETETGFCLVQEYKNAQSLAVRHRFAPEQIKQIAIAVLEILVYLQNRIPPVVHRDIKPENILVSDRLKVYLVDFGLARIGSGEVAQSSVISGTPGFMPPEQLLNLEVTESSDLYGLGVTLICLLAKTPSAEITKLIDSNYRINFRELLPSLSDEFANWLEKMVQPNPSDRFANAAASLEALTPITVDRSLPEIELSPSSWEARATFGQVLTKTIALKNSVPNTVLEGRWQIVPSASEPSASPDWLSVKPAKFKGNQVECVITADAGNLLVGRVSSRNLFLQANTAERTHVFTVQIEVVPDSGLSDSGLPDSGLPDSGLPEAALAQAEAASIAAQKKAAILPAILFLICGASPVVPIVPEVAIAIAIPLAATIAPQLSQQIQDKDIDRIARVAQKWIMAPSLAALGIWFATHLGISSAIDWLDHPEIKVLAILLLAMAMGGVGIGVLDLLKATLKRAIALLPIFIFASSYVLLGETAGLAGRIAEVAIAAWLLSRTVKKEIEAKNISFGLAARKFGSIAIAGIGLGSLLTWLLLYLGIGSLGSASFLF